MAILLEKILKAAETEADWLRYYGHSETRMLGRMKGRELTKEVRDMKLSQLGI